MNEKATAAGAKIDQAPSQTQQPSSQAAYTIASVKRACDILKCFDSEQELLQLDEITARVHLPRPTTFRILCTLVTCGLLERQGKNRYTLSTTWKPRNAYRFGYAGESEEFSFSRLVRDSVHRCAYQQGVELVLLDNRYSAARAIRNAERFVAEKVDLVIEFQAHQATAPQVAAVLAGAGIPVIAIEIPHPGAYFYGANNYRAGWMGGHHLAQSCLNIWGGKVDELILIGLPIAGQIPQTRMTGMLAGVRELLPKFHDRQVVALNGNGQYEQSLDAIRKHLRKSKARHVLMGGINDPSSLGGLRAFEEAGRANDCLVVGQNASIEARREMRTPSSRFVGSVAYFPENYGEAVLAFALDILRGKEVPPALFVKHRMVTKANVDEIYPNDALIATEGIDSLLYSCR
jgi:ribose transport system substrate-binding protein